MCNLFLLPPSTDYKVMFWYHYFMTQKERNDLRGSKGKGLLLQVRWKSLGGYIIYDVCVLSKKNSRSHNHKLTKSLSIDKLVRSLVKLKNVWENLGSEGVKILLMCVFCLFCFCTCFQNEKKDRWMGGWRRANLSFSLIIFNLTRPLNPDHSSFFTV